MYFCLKYLDSKCIQKFPVWLWRLAPSKQALQLSNETMANLSNLVCFKRHWDVFKASKTQRQWFHLPDHLTQTIASQLSLIAMQISSPITTQAARVCLSHKKPHYERSFHWSESIWLQLYFMTELKYKKTLLAETFSSCLIHQSLLVSFKCRVNGLLITWTSHLISFGLSNFLTRWRTGLWSDAVNRTTSKKIQASCEVGWKDALMTWAVL